MTARPDTAAVAESAVGTPEGVNQEKGQNQMTRENTVNVPVEPTEAMLSASTESLIEQYDANGDWDDAKDVIEKLDTGAIYRAMLSAAPLHEGEGELGNHDCLAKRRPGEPMFILLGRDPDAHNVVRFWADRRLAAGGDPEHCRMGHDTADRMKAYASDPANAPASAPSASSYAAPPPSVEVERLREDAERFRALMRCGRIKMQGSSGVDPHTGERNGNNVHFGAEFWPEPIEPEWEETYRAGTTWGRACIRALADAILEEEARAALRKQEPGVPTPGAWIEWSGGENPVPGRYVDLRFRNGVVGEREWSDDQQGADDLPGAGWLHSDAPYDIIAYRIVPTPGGEVK